MAKVYVVATKLGFNGVKRVPEGKKFWVEDNLFSEKWMRKTQCPKAEIDTDEDEVEAIDPEVEGFKDAAGTEEEGVPLSQADKPRLKERGRKR